MMWLRQLTEVEHMAASRPEIEMTESGTRV